MKIKFWYDSIRYRLRGAGEAKEMIEKVIRSERKVPGDLNFIFTSDRKLIKINREFLKHNYFTDVIAFGYYDGTNSNLINGEIYISIETVKSNGINYKVSLKEELRRVMIHGTLHLCGYDDKDEKGRNKMKEREDFWLALWKNKSRWN